MDELLFVPVFHALCGKELTERQKFKK